MVMSSPGDRRPSTERLKNVARLTSDLSSIQTEQLKRLRAILAAVPEDRIQREESPETFAFGGSLSERLATIEPDDALRELVAVALPDEDEDAELPLHALRRDSQDDLLSMRIASPLTALGGAERIGPFELDDRTIVFDFWRAAAHFEVFESGATAPAFVLSSARRPAFSIPGSLTLDLQAGTAWIRGDLLDSGLPDGAYVGITVTDGQLRLAEVAFVSEDRAAIAAPVNAELELELTVESVTATENGCLAKAVVALPTLTLGFGSRGLTISDSGGSANVWGQSFDFGSPTGSLRFIPELWTLLLDCKVAQDTFDGSAIQTQLAEFAGKCSISEAALGLPVVVANPAALGTAALGPSWWLALEGLNARWYEPDARFHQLNPVMRISDGAVTIYDRAAAPLFPPVKTVYRLWKLNSTVGSRLPWDHDYTQDFFFHYRCHAANGEGLTTTGAATVRLDRPVDANGRMINMFKTPMTNSVMSQQTDGDDVTVKLTGFTSNSADTLLVLQNALVWASTGNTIQVQGQLIDRQLIDSGRLFVPFGVYGWSPTLPDPYVGNFDVCVPKRRALRSLQAAIRWTAQTAPETRFGGELGLPVVCDRPQSSNQPVPAPRTIPTSRKSLNPDVGPTQEDQGRLYPSKRQFEAILSAKQEELSTRKERAANASRTNKISLGNITNQLRKRLGQTPTVFLLDVSTNQDLLGVALEAAPRNNPATASVPEAFSVRGMAVTAPLAMQRLVMLPQVQWEPVRTLDVDQDILTLGWFPTPLASANDGGPTVLGARSQQLSPVIPENVLDAAGSVFEEGTNVVFKTTLPFGIVTVVDVNPQDSPGRRADTFSVTRPVFPEKKSRGGIQITAKAEGGRSDAAISPYFVGETRQLINGVDLVTGEFLGLSVLSSTGDPMSDVATIFNNDMSTNPKVPITRFDLSGYGGSNFSKWENPFALFAETAKTQFEMTLGRCALEIIKVASVLHPWGINVTRSVIVERRSGGGVIRRDTGWQATSSGIFDYRYVDTIPSPPEPKVADYAFDAGIFQGLHNVRAIRPAPGAPFSDGNDASLVPYYFDADLALDGLTGTTPARGILGWLQTEPTGEPANQSVLQALIEAQGPIGGPIDAWIDFGPSGLPFRAQRIEVDVTVEVTQDGTEPLFVATVRGIPRLPKTGSWSVVRRPVSGFPPGGGEAVPVSESKGVPIIRRAVVAFDPMDDKRHDKPQIAAGGSSADWRMADPGDLLTPASPANDYCLLQSAPTHAFLFPRPVAGTARIESTEVPELADIIARSTSKGAFPPPENAIKLPASLLKVGPDGGLSLPNPVTVVNHPSSLRLAGESGHGSELLYDTATLRFVLNNDSWEVDFTGLHLWSDIAGLKKASGVEMHIVGGTYQRPQVAQIKTLVHDSVENILTYLPIFGAREPLGPFDLGASNAKREIKIELGGEFEVPKNVLDVFDIGVSEPFKLLLGIKLLSVGFDLDTEKTKVSGELTTKFKGETQSFVGQLDVKFSIASVMGVVKEEKLELIAFAGAGVKGYVWGFKAYAYLGIGFVFIYDYVEDKPKYGGLVRFEAGITFKKICKVKLLAELKGLVSKKPVPLLPPEMGSKDKTVCDYTGNVKLQVDIFMVISINATYTVSGTKELE